MEIKKLNIKKGATIRDTMLVIVFFISGLGLIFAFAANNAIESGVEIDQKINDTYNNLQQQQNNISLLVTDISYAASNLSEAKIGDFAFFGLRGVLELMKLPLRLISIASNSWNMVSVIFPIPDVAKTMVAIGILIIIIFAIIKFVTSRGTEA